MIVIVDDRCMVYDAFKSSFGREGVIASGFTSNEFEDWISSAGEEDFKAIDAFLLGEYRTERRLTGVIKMRCGAAVIAMREHRSLNMTLDLFAEGVDDVVVKPCHVREILARVEAIRRRLRADFDGMGAGDIQTFHDGRDPIVAGLPLALPRRELKIFEFLVSNRSRSVTKAQIFNSVYGIFEQEIDEKVIESHVSKLRGRLRGRLKYDPIESRRHLGYRLLDHHSRSGDGDCSGLNINLT